TPTPRRRGARTGVPARGAALRTLHRTGTFARPSKSPPETYRAVRSVPTARREHNGVAVMKDAGNFDQARNLVLNLLDTPTPTPEALRSAVDSVTGMLAARGDSPDPEDLLRRLEAELNVFQADSVSLDDNRGHLEWLSARMPEIRWSFWDRYFRYVRE